MVADIAKRNNLGTLVKGKNLTWHSIYSNTACPGAYLLSKMDYIATEANKSPQNASNITSGIVSTIQKWLNDNYSYVFSTIYSSR